MANVWGTSPIKIDTAASDTSYDAANDANKISTGVQYHTGNFTIKAIHVLGANGDDFSLQQCTPDASVDNGAEFCGGKLETGQLNKEYYFGKDGYKCQGIYPKTVDSGVIIKIFK